MTAVDFRQTRNPAEAGLERSARMTRRILLPCGVLSPLVYLAADVVGGLRYKGYSFTSQAISELMATGAPSESFVDPLFIMYGVLMVIFGAGVLRESADDERALRIAGALLVGYAAIGLTGPIFFEMHQRGAGSVDADRPHIVLTGVLVLLTLLSIGSGALALGRRFRIYSFATIAILVIMGVASVPYGSRLATGEPTPAFGIIERILIYASLSWVAAFAVTLARRPRHRPARTA
jgi:hypothetical protein